MNITLVTTMMMLMMLMMSVSFLLFPHFPGQVEQPDRPSIAVSHVQPYKDAPKRMDERTRTRIKGNARPIISRRPETKLLHAKIMSLINWQGRSRRMVEVAGYRHVTKQIADN
uniref:Secreted protein n=1 Tax=Anopheles maculatus TaxID=74869 RepID=A0A182SJM1_9DIPT